MPEQPQFDKPKTVIVPIKITVMVDDPTKYDAEMESFVKQVLNELRSVISSAKAPVKVDFGATIKDVSVWDRLIGPSNLVQEIDKILNDFKKAMGK